MVQEEAAAEEEHPHRLDHKIDCEHAQQGLCLISTALAEIPVPLAEDSCRACQKQDNPRTFNRVTCSKAIYQLRNRSKDRRIKIPPILKDCIRPKPNGVGTQLEALIEKHQSLANYFSLGWLFAKQPNCNCGAIKNQLNYFSRQEVRESVNVYTSAIAKQFVHRHGVPWLYCVAWPYAKILLLIAIKRS